MRLGVYGPVIPAYKREHESPKDSPSSDFVELVDDDSSWPSQFDEVVSELKAILGSEAHRFEHIGSTAVPGLVAKPIIDVLVGVSDDDAARTVAVPQLMKAGYYECYWRFDSPPAISNA